MLGPNVDMSLRPFGLERLLGVGFTVERRPEGVRGLVLAPDFSGGARARMACNSLLTRSGLSGFRALGKIFGFTGLIGHTPYTAADPFGALQPDDG